ncbi:MAG TPA: GDP-mannose 4,6-dehydratase [Ginsengibacter sp.]
MTAIIFGAGGQDGFYLSKLLKEKGFTVIGITRKENSVCNIADYSSVSNLIKDKQPDFVFHLAANSTTRHDALFENHEIIATGTLNILESIKNFSQHTKVFISGSGLQFKNEGNPIKETDAFEARDAYSVSRIQSVYAARYYRTLGMKSYVGYFFNHDSPSRTERHITKKIAEAAKRIATGSNEKLEIGDINVIKEYAYADDIVNGIWTLVNQEKILEANVSSGEGYSIKDWIIECFSLINKNYENYIATREDFIPEYKKLVSDPSLIFSLGWKPEVSFHHLAKIMMA